MEPSSQPGRIPAEAAAPGPPAAVPAGAVSWVEVDLAALAGNVRAFRERLGPRCALAAVVKSNAYGHGVEHVAPVALAAGATQLAVVNLAEGLEVRALAGEDVPVLVLGHVPPGGLEQAVSADLELTVYEDELLRALEAAATRVGRPARVHLKLETGTHRQGLPLEALTPLARRIAASPWLELQGLTTHFADIEDTTDHGFAVDQIDRFREAATRLAAENLRPRALHTACSAAAILFADTHLDIARVGIGLYGLWPSRETMISARERGLGGLDLRPALSWKCVIAQVKEVPAGSYVGYGRTWRATRPSRIAVLPVGYYEGYDRALSGRAHVLVHGRRAPVAGRICMNMFMADVTDVPAARAGDVAVLIGASGDERVRAEDLARWADTIHYEITSRINPAVPRVAAAR
jgi:alanine racemase